MIRLMAIELRNFKNVSRGRISLSSFDVNSEDWGADVIGIYGQNGSGKTSVITALYVLKAIWDIGELPGFCEECIAAGSDRLTIAVDAVSHACHPERPNRFFTYSVDIAGGDDGLRIVRERLTYKNLDEQKPTRKTAFDYVLDGTGTTLGPKTSWDALCAMDKNLSFNMALSQKIVSSEGRSLLMSDDFDSLLHDMGKVFSERLKGGSVSKAGAKAYDGVWTVISSLRAELRLFAVENLSIITQSRQAEPMLNMLRISTHEGSARRSADAYFGVDLSAPALVSVGHIAALRSTIDTIGTVLGALVPGLELGIESLGQVMGDDGAMGERIEIVATRGGVTVPLRAESEGIKKLVSILILLVDVYSRPDVCVAIDELDSGIFEFLLGELLQVLQDHGRGQLIFTAHNLRPLETLDKTALVFTTTNPENRYITFKGSKATNNLRSQYLRAVNLGGQPETIYEATSKYEIDSAFYDAGNPESWD